MSPGISVWFAKKFWNASALSHSSTASTWSSPATNRWCRQPCALPSPDTDANSAARSRCASPNIVGSTTNLTITVTDIFYPRVQGGGRAAGPTSVLVPPHLRASRTRLSTRACILVQSATRRPQNHRRGPFPAGIVRGVECDQEVAVGLRRRAIHGRSRHSLPATTVPTSHRT